MDREVLTVRERAYILDKIGGTSFYLDEFGEIEGEKEKELVTSISKKLELTYYLPSGSQNFRLDNSDSPDAKEVLENFKKIFGKALSE